METRPLPSCEVAPSTGYDPSPTPSKKRNYDGIIIERLAPTTPVLEHFARLSNVEYAPRPSSPSLSSRSSPLSDLGSTPCTSPQKDPMAPESSKKRKLTFAEREVEKSLKKQEKEQKEKEKADAKAAKDEEKRRRDEERDAARKAKEAVREEKQKAREVAQQEKDAEKKRKETAQHEKEAEKKRKEAEILKKQRSQMRIGAFFGRTVSATSPPTTPENASMEPLSRRSSIASIEIDSTSAEIGTSTGSTNPEFNKWILPFFKSDHSDMAPFNRFHRNLAPLDHAEPLLNQIDTPESLPSQFTRRQRKREIRPVRVIVERMTTHPDDLDKCGSLLATVPYKFLCFREDVRPAYQGTFSRAVSPKSSRKLARNPVHRGLPNVNYDYDSEAEWEEPEDGDDDLMDEDEMSEDEAGEDEMADFLDDEAEQVKRRLLVGEMEPVSSGLCWQGQDNKSIEGFDMAIYRMDVLHDSTSLPIDPYSNTHWTDIGKPSPRKKEPKISGSVSEMQPPRLPLMTLDANSGNLTPSRSTIGASGEIVLAEKLSATPKPKAKTNTKPTKMIAPDLLPAFKAAVVDSTLSKIGLVEVLKDLFPKCPKDAIKDTLMSIAVKQGGKDKKWVLV